MDAYLVKFDAAGNRIWATYYGGTEDDQGAGLSTDAAGNVFLAGFTESPSGIADGGHQNTLSGMRDAFLAKFDADGMRLWATYYGGLGSDGGYALSTDAAGNVFLAGETSSTSGIAYEGYQNTIGGNRDAYLAQFDTDGARLWGTYYGGGAYDRGSGLSTDGAGNVFLAGYTRSSTGIAADGHQNTYGSGTDAFLAKFSPEPPCDIAIDEVQPTGETCPGANDGGITVAASCTTCTGISYGISGPVSMSNEDGVFTGLPDGVYTVTVEDTGDETCTDMIADVAVAAGIDNTPPIIDCATGLTLDFNSEIEFFMADLQSQLILSAEDNCDGTDLTYSYAPETISCAQIGQTVDVEITICDQNAIPNCNSCTVPVTVTGLPCGWSDSDEQIGCTDCTTSYDPDTDTYTTTAGSASSSPYSGGPDAAAFMQQTLCGNGELIAHVDGLDGPGKGWAGIVMRDGNAPDAPMFQLMTGLDYLQHRVDWRLTAGSTRQSLGFSRYGQHWLRIVRTGPIFQAYTSWDGINWGLPVNTQVIQTANCLEVGLVSTNVPYATNVTATFSGVSVIGLRPPTPDSKPNTDTHAMEAYPNPTDGTLTVNLGRFLEQSATLEVLNAFGQLIEQRPLGIIENRTEVLDLS
ncbi:MAG: hypothetical protein KDC54_25010, partial [Lewinella sp.]|nr:hypothetical protein [Lewinella sp.]